MYIWCLLIAISVYVAEHTLILRLTLTGIFLSPTNLYQALSPLSSSLLYSIHFSQTLRGGFNLTQNQAEACLVTVPPFTA